MIKDIMNIIAVPVKYPAIKRKSLLDKYQLNYEYLESEK
jgi:hypothetical protein